VRRTLACRLDLAFFGLTPDYRLELFNQIHQIVFHGKGGYGFQEVYDMPIWLRRFTFNKIKEFYDEKNESEQKQVKKANTAANKLKTPHYKVKAANK
jgi:hypothetical protein